MGRRVVLIGLVLCAACSGTQAREDAGKDAGAPDGGVWDAGLGRSDAGPCDDRTFIRACTPLYRCGSAPPPRPADGKCDAGLFPVRDYACGRPLREADGGYSCGCHELPLDLPGVGPVNDERCVAQCDANLNCAAGTCVRVPANWGNDTNDNAWVPLCL